MVAPFSFKHTGMHCFAQSERDSTFSTQAITITKQISNDAVNVFFEAIMYIYGSKLLLQGHVAVIIYYEGKRM